MESIFASSKSYSHQTAGYRLAASLPLHHRFAAKINQNHDLKTDDTNTWTALSMINAKQPKKRSRFSALAEAFVLPPKRPDSKILKLHKRNSENFKSDEESNSKKNVTSKRVKSCGDLLQNQQLEHSDFTYLKKEKLKCDFTDFENFYEKWILGEELSVGDLKLNALTAYLFRKIVEKQGYYSCSPRDYHDLNFYRNLQESTFKKTTEEKCKYAIKLSHKFLKQEYGGRLSYFHKLELPRRFKDQPEEDAFFYFFFLEHCEKQEISIPELFFRKKNQQKKSKSTVFAFFGVYLPHCRHLKSNNYNSRI